MKGSAEHAHKVLASIAPLYVYFLFLTFHRTIGKQCELLFVKVPGIVKDVWLDLIQVLEVYALHKFALRIVDPGETVDFGQVHHRHHIAHERIGRHDLIEDPAIDVSLIPFLPRITENIDMVSANAFIIACGCHTAV